MGVLLEICCIFSEHIFLTKPGRLLLLGVDYMRKASSLLVHQGVKNEPGMKPFLALYDEAMHPIYKADQK